MFNFARWQSNTALIMVLGMASSAATPLLMSAPAQATFAPSTIAQNQNIKIPAGTVIPVKHENEKIVLTPNETVPTTLTVSQNVKSTKGTVLIPAGSQLKGELKPASNGTQFVAETLTLTNGRKLAIDASSNVVTKQEEIRKETNTDSILKGAAIGGGAAALIRGITGHGFRVGTVLLGGGAGALGGLLFGKKSVKVTVIRPATDLTVKLNSPLSL